MADRNESALPRMAWKGNVELMLRGEKCWTWHFVKAMSAIGAIKNAAAVEVQGRRTARNVQDTVEKIMHIHFHEEMVESKAYMFLDKTWEECQPLNPATAPSAQVFISVRWY